MSNHSSATRVFFAVHAFLACLVFASTATVCKAAIYDITFELLTPLGVPLSTLRFDVDYSAAGGEFEGSGSNVTCVLHPDVAGTIYVYYDCDTPGGCKSFDEDTLVQAFLASSVSRGFTPPVRISTCAFEKAGRAPVPGEFAITVTEVTDVSGNPVTATGAIHSIASRAACGNRVREPGEACDHGKSNGVFGDSCSEECGIVACGEPNNSGDVTASDALIVLKAAVGLFACDACVCDVDRSGSVVATDALRVLKSAIGLNVLLTCPTCETSSTTTTTTSSTTTTTTNSTTTTTTNSTTTTTLSSGGCPIDFNDEKTSGACVFHGAWHDPSCGTIDAYLGWEPEKPDGEWIKAVFLLGSGSPVPPFLQFCARLPTNGRSADLHDYFLLSPPNVNMGRVFGPMSLNQDGTILTIDPSYLPFKLGGCRFDAFVGDFVESSSGIPVTAQCPTFK